MIVLPFTIPKPNKDALVYQVDQDKLFYGHLHQHKEIQLSYIVTGWGTLIVGNTINQYQSGDILVLGSQVPHVFKSDKRKGQTSHMLSLFFTKDSFGKDFFDLKELSELNEFFERSKQGIKLRSKQKEMAGMFLNLESTTKLERFVILLQLLKIASTASFERLSSFVNDKKITASEGNRLRDIFEYSMKHFYTEVPLELIADKASMTKTAFCKFFKKRTNKTYVTFLNELRIEHACKLLAQDPELSIGDVAFQSGFKNISHFNRQFKKNKEMTPKAYKNKAGIYGVFD